MTSLAASKAPDECYECGKITTYLDDKLLIDGKTMCVTCASLKLQKEGEKCTYQDLETIIFELANLINQEADEGSTERSSLQINNARKILDDILVKCRKEFCEPSQLGNPEFIKNPKISSCFFAACKTKRNGKRENEFYRKGKRFYG